MNNQDMNIKNPTFGGFKPDAMSRIAKSMGYEGNMSGFQQYLDQNPDKRTQMDQFTQAAMMMARGGSVQQFNQGGSSVANALNAFNTPSTYDADTFESTYTTSDPSSVNTTSAGDIGSGAFGPSFVKGKGLGAMPAAQMKMPNQANQNFVSYYNNQNKIISKMGSPQNNPMSGMSANEANAYKANQLSMQKGTGNPQSATYQASLGQVTPEQVAAQQQANAAQVTPEQMAAMQPQMQEVPADVQQRLDSRRQEQDRINQAMQEKFGEQGNPDNYIPEFSSKIKTLQDNMEATNLAFFTSKGIAEGDYSAMRKYMQSNPNAQQELNAALQADQQQVDALTQQLQNNPEFKAFQAEAEQYQRSIDPDTGRPPETGGPALPMPIDPIRPPLPPEPEPDLGGYDPSKGMPEALPDEFITSYTTDQPSWAKEGLTEMFKSGKLPEDPADFTSESLGGKKYKITYKDGTTMEVGPIGKFDTEPDTIRTLVAEQINKFKTSPEYTQKKAQQDAYRKYISEETTGGVTGDIENIEEEYNKVKSTYKQQELELQRLQAQAEANPDDPYLKQLVEEKGKEVSDSYSRIQQLEPTFLEGQKTIEDVMTERATDPTLPEGTKIEAQKIQTAPDQFIAEGTGSLEGDISYDPVKGVVTTSEGVEKAEAATYDATTVTDKAKAELDKVKAARLDEFSDGVIFEGEQGELSEGAYADEALKVAADRIQKVNEKVDLEVTKQQLAEAKGKNLKAIETKVAKSSALLDAVAAAHVVQPNELPTPQLIAEEDMAQAKAMTDTGLDKDAIPIAAKMASFSVDNGTLAKAAQGDVDSLATVEGQLGKLMKQFDDGTPAWAAGAIRAANAAMSSRGLGASSMAGAAILQAAMESALPIAQQDAKTFADMGMRNLDNRQQVAVANAAAQQGLQLQNLDNEQKANLQKSINAFGLQTQNLSNRQASEVANAQIRATLQGQNLSNMQTSNIAEAARYAEAANINLNNKQQAAMQDNSNALQTNLAELSAEQSAYINSANAAATLQGQVLSNDQQVSIANAARYSEAANIEFTAEQQNALHNSKLMSSIGLAELNATQAATLQNAASVANMDITNLNNRQQAAVAGAKAFLQRDMTNLSNEQQTAIFKAQSTQQALLSDQAAENAAKQFNATSQNQTNQFYDNLKQQNNQFNAAQTNAMEQFNVGQENAAQQFNAEMKNNREQFNAQNELVVAQSNATWRREVATADTAAENRAIELNAINTLDISNQAYDNMWNTYGDQMEWAVNSYESEADRVNALTLETMRQDGTEKAAKYAADSNASSAVGGAVVRLLTADTGIISDLF